MSLAVDIPSRALAHLPRQQDEQQSQSHPWSPASCSSDSVQESDIEIISEVVGQIYDEQRDVYVPVHRRSGSGASQASTAPTSVASSPRELSKELPSCTYTLCSTQSSETHLSCLASDNEQRKHTPAQSAPSYTRDQLLSLASSSLIHTSLHPVVTPSLVAKFPFILRQKGDGIARALEMARTPVNRHSFYSLPPPPPPFPNPVHGLEGNRNRRLTSDGANVSANSTHMVSPYHSSHMHRWSRDRPPHVQFSQPALGFQLQHPQLQYPQSKGQSLLSQLAAQKAALLQQRQQMPRSQGQMQSLGHGLGHLTRPDPAIVASVPSVRSISALSNVMPSHSSSLSPVMEQQAEEDEDAAERGPRRRRRHRRRKSRATKAAAFASDEIEDEGGSKNVKSSAPSDDNGVSNRESVENLVDAQSPMSQRKHSSPSLSLNDNHHPSVQRNILGIEKRQGAPSHMSGFNKRQRAPSNSAGFERRKVTGKVPTFADHQTPSQFKASFPQDKDIAMARHMSTIANSDSDPPKFHGRVEASHRFRYAHGGDPESWRTRRPGGVAQADRA